VVGRSNRSTSNTSWQIVNQLTTSRVGGLLNKQAMRCCAAYSESLNRRSAEERCVMKHRYQVPVKLKRWGWLILLFLVVTFAVQLPIQVSASKSSCQVEYIRDRLTIKVDNAALGAVLAAIREKTGIEFVLSQELSEVPISIQLGPLPVVEGLKRILSHSNHAFIFGTNNKLVKIVILNYTKLDSSPRPREVTETPSVPRGITPSSAETKVIKPATKEGSAITSGEDMTSQPSPETTVIEPSSAEGMIVTPSTLAMVIHPPPIDMIITPSSETMVVKPASAEGMVVVTPPTRTMANIMESMSINAFTGESKPKAR
jgi:hypothetical protein